MRLHGIKEKYIVARKMTIPFYCNTISFITTALLYEWNEFSSDYKFLLLRLKLLTANINYKDSLRKNTHEKL
jgi:hypothetical protein